MRRIYIKYLIIIILFLASDYARAQSFYSRKMEDLCGEIPQACLPRADSIFNCAGLVKGKSLIELVLEEKKKNANALSTYK